MFDFLLPVFIVGFICAGIYGIFELFARKSERLAMIEKLSEISSLNGKVKLPDLNSRLSFNALKIGSLLTGLGLGLLVAFLITNNVKIEGLNNHGWRQGDIYGIIYSACLLIFGGIALLTAFIVELKINNTKNKDQ